MSSAFERLFDLFDRYRGNIFWENRLDRNRHMLMPALVIRCVFACRSLVFCVWSLSCRPAIFQFIPPASV